MSIQWNTTQRLKKDRITDTHMDGCQKHFLTEKKKIENITDSFYIIHLYEMLEKSKLMHSDREQMKDCLWLSGELGWRVE